MPANHWRLRDAKTQFCQAVSAALAGEPQHISRRGKPTVAALSEESFEACKRSGQAATPAIAYRRGPSAAPAGNDSTDLRIAATALSHGLQVATRNVRHFAATGVGVVDPFEQG
jgi:antitoxin (DNA-binding transcriptional repressor) of toxin-antitoxin stability system